MTRQRRGRKLKSFRLIAAWKGKWNKDRKCKSSDYFRIKVESVLLVRVMWRSSALANEVLTQLELWLGMPSLGFKSCTIKHVNTFRMRCASEISLHPSNPKFLLKSQDGFALFSISKASQHLVSSCTAHVQSHRYWFCFIRYETSSLLRETRFRKFVILPEVKLFLFHSSASLLNAFFFNNNCSLEWSFDFVTSSCNSLRWLLHARPGGFLSRLFTRQNTDIRLITGFEVTKC